VLAGFSRYSWPGNVRELDALMRRYSILAGDHARTPDEDEAMLGDLFAELLAQEAPDLRDREIGEASGVECVSPEREMPTSGAPPQARDSGDLRQAMEAFEMNYIRNTLRACRFNRQETARRLGVSVNTLWRKLRQ
jgi:propionate catabolism operon transcriptional regulator